MPSGQSRLRNSPRRPLADQVSGSERLTGGRLLRTSELAASKLAAWAMHRFDDRAIDIA